MREGAGRDQSIVAFILSQYKLAFVVRSLVNGIC
ncbi:hypothetical protein Msil_3347 [Methylocella silvestris BL2]|uniref:Uncharacterized protein n=1 Tax=Methylocella silvestris (strain DSM 15510 / CIP 108128 / LMG 27833 / NCIMB 13906 / BL2) TaxID=395965 RepID=B8ES38_METSB|nr:hypothetical protein Msil_3347 [Methylocella silvestris BL2]